MFARLCVSLCVSLPFVGIVSGQTIKDLFKDSPTVTIATGTIGGRVLFADTNGPASFTKVFLKAAKPSDPGDNLFSALAASADDTDKAGKSGASKLSAADKAEQTKTKAASASLFSALADLMVTTTVSADGSYSFSNVKPGTYYVHIQAPGYIDPLAQFSSDDLLSADPTVRARIAAVATTVTVNGMEPAHADLRLERGADISGRVLYDDGTPAVGWTVHTVHKLPAGEAGSGFAMMGLDAGDLDITHLSENSITDDTGHFRVAGLPTGDYILQARLTAAAPGRSSLNPVASTGRSGAGMMAGAFGLKLTVYSGNASRQQDAKPVSVRAGEDRSGVDMTVPLSHYRMIAGSVQARRDGHPVNGGSVELTALDGTGKEDTSLHWVSSVQPDGSFRFGYVPGPGQFVVKVTHAVDATSGPTRQVFGSLVTEQKTTRSYDPASQTITLGDGDVSDVKISVSDTEPAK